MISCPAFFRSLSTLHSRSIRWMFSRPVACASVEVPHFYNDTHTAAPFRPLRACVFAHYISSTCKMQETLFDRTTKNMSCILR